MIQLNEKQAEAVKNILEFAKEHITKEDEPLLPELEKLFNLE